MTRAETAQLCERMGHRIRARRLFMELTQEQIAKLTGIHVQQVRKYETGSSEPQAFILLALARALDTSADYLLGRHDSERGSKEPTSMLSEPAVAAILRRLHGMDEKGRKRALMLLIAGEESRA